MSEILDGDATAQAAAVRDGSMSPAELVAHVHNRIGERDPAVGALVGEVFTEPVVFAPAQQPDSGAPFRGVPILLKDAGQELAGTAHWVGTAGLRAVAHRSTRTTALTARLLRAGFVVLGKTNVPELSAGSTTEPAAFHPTRNPADLGRSAGGSSGGSAAAVASGMVAIATGADATGSLRYPASACGVLTLKPTAGRVPSEVPAGGSDPVGAWCDFVLARSARDLAALFTIATAGTAPGSGPTPLLRVGLLTHDPILDLVVDSECVAATEAVGRRLEALGHHVEVDHPAALTHLLHPLAAALATITADTRNQQATWLTARLGRPPRVGDVEPATLAQLSGRPPSPDEVAAAAATIRDGVAPALAWWRDHDVLVTPTMRQPPWPIGASPTIAAAGAFCFMASLSGPPALSIPAGRTGTGLPIGVQLVGRPGADELLLRLAADPPSTSALARRSTHPAWRGASRRRDSSTRPGAIASKYASGSTSTCPSGPNSRGRGMNAA